MKSQRPPTDWEERVIERLLEPTFPGCDELRAQAEHLLVREIDENGSLSLNCETSIVAPVEKRVPTEGESTDLDGVTIHFLLHVVGGKMKELEVYKDDSSRVQQLPDSKDITVLILG